MSAPSTEKPGFFRRISSKAKIASARSAAGSSTLTDPSSLSTGSVHASETGHTLDGDDAGSSKADGLPPSSQAPDAKNQTPTSSHQHDQHDHPENTPSRWYLHTRAYTLRQLASLGFNLQHRADPPAPAPTSTIYIDSTISQWPGVNKIQIDIWRPSTPSASISARSGVVVFHGGGFVLGNGTDDSRWAGALMEHLDAVVFAVNYRMAPGYPFPTPVEDCAEGILHVAKVAKEYGVDPNKLFISGFSAGGNLAFASYFLLHSAKTWGYTITPPNIRGIVAFYPLLDFTIPRKSKKDSCNRPEFCLPDSLTGLFDQSYLHPPPDRSDPRISPAKAPDEMIKLLPPVHLCVCEWDMLCAEGKRFRDRLENLGMPVTLREVKEEKHGWDKPPPMTPKKSVLEEYVHAVESMKRWIGNVSEDDRLRIKEAEVGMEQAIDHEEGKKRDGVKEKLVDGLDKMALKEHRDEPRR